MHRSLGLTVGARAPRVHFSGIVTPTTFSFRGLNKLLNAPAAICFSKYAQDMHLGRRHFSSAGAESGPAARWSSTAATKSAQNRISHLGALSRAAVSAGAAFVALADPSRGDMVALLGELTAPLALRKMRDSMMSNPEGRLILSERPRIRESSLDIDALLAGPQNTFGAAYARYLRRHSFTPDERHEVTCVDGDTPDGELSYVLQRYREVHDMWHVLSGLPPTVLGEAAVKWLEMVVTGLPMAALAAFAAPARLPPREARAYFSIYVPWASRVGAAAAPLMSVRYERLMERDLSEVRAALSFKPAPADGPAGFMG